MNKISDWDKKKMPYTTPDGFFDELEDRVWQEVKGDYAANGAANDASCEPDRSTLRIANVAKTPSRRPSRLRMWFGGAVAVAASVALVFTIGSGAFKQQTYTVNDVDQAFSQLNTDDQAFLLSVYQDDVFINE